VNEQTSADLASMWDAVDPVPDGLVARMQAVAAAEVEIADADLDYELMLLVERSTEPVGTRGAAAYTLRFAYDDIDLLVRPGGSTDVQQTRMDGWIVPPGDVNVRVQLVDRSERGDLPQEWVADVDPHGRFEFPNLPTGLVRLWLLPRDGAKPFATPAFEI
jgi:hypothetical protein